MAGDAGAPVEESEVSMMEEILPEVKPFMNVEGIRSVEEQGVAIQDPYGPGLVTPLVDGKQCAFVVFDEKGSTMCSIELAWKAGKVEFQKPISCHLYPIRIHEYEAFQALNYHRWEICSPACELGTELKVPVYKFAESALRRKFGDRWYEEFEKVVEAWSKNIGEDS